MTEALTTTTATRQHVADCVGELCKQRNILNRAIAWMDKAGLEEVSQSVNTTYLGAVAEGLQRTASELTALQELLIGGGSS